MKPKNFFIIIISMFILLCVSEYFLYDDFWGPSYGYDISYRHVIGEIKNISEDVDVQNVHIGYSFDRPPYATYINVTLKNIDADCENHIVACGSAYGNIIFDSKCS